MENSEIKYNLSNVDPQLIKALIENGFLFRTREDIHERGYENQAFQLSQCGGVDDLLCF